MAVLICGTLLTIRNIENRDHLSKDHLAFPTCYSQFSANLFLFLTERFKSELFAYYLLLAG